MVVASDGSARRHSGDRIAKLARQPVQSAVAKPMHAQRATAARPGNTENKPHQMETNSPPHTSHPLVLLQYLPASPPVQPSPTTQRLTQPPRLPSQPRRPPHCLPGTQITPPSATTPTQPSDAQTSTPSNTNPTTTTPPPTQTAVGGPPAGSSKFEIGGQPSAARHDQAEIPPKRLAKPDAPATM